MTNQAIFRRVFERFAVAINLRTTHSAVAVEGTIEEGVMRVVMCKPVVGAAFRDIPPLLPQEGGQRW